MITARIDIYPSANACHESQYKKTFLVGNIDVASPQQAVMGRIYNIGDDFSHVVDRQLAQESRSFVSVGTTNYDIDKRRPEVIKMIAQDTGAQYIIGGDITDLTATIESKLLKDDVINRQFALEMQVFDGKQVIKFTIVAIVKWQNGHLLRPVKSIHAARASGHPLMAA